MSVLIYIPRQSIPTGESVLKMPCVTGGFAVTFYEYTALIADCFYKEGIIRIKITIQNDSCNYKLKINCKKISV